MSGVVATVFGSNGFWDNSLSTNFGKIGSRVVTLSRRADLVDVHHLKLMGDWVKSDQCSLISRLEFLRNVIRGSNVVINLIGNKTAMKLPSMIST